MTKRGRFEVVRTEGGARAMRDHETGEVMHPEVGALVEARALYLDASRLVQRLNEATDRPLVLLDVGLGAGTNSALACSAAFSLRASRPLHIVSFDLTRDALRVALDEAPEAFGFTGPVRAAGERLCACGSYRDAHVHWRLELGDARETLSRLSDASADVVFWDPYSPRASETLWSCQVFSLLHAKCRARATLHTYSAATATRSALLLAGFCVGKGPRANPKQRSSTEAALCPRDLRAPLDAAWLRSMSSQPRALPPDAPPDALLRLASAPQFAPAVSG